MLFTFLSCSQSSTPGEKPIYIQTLEVIGRDTVNRVDSKGRKQGMWLLFEDKNRIKVKDTLFYKDGKIVTSAK